MSQEGPTIYDKDRVAIIAGVSVSVILVLAIVITVAILCYCRSLKTRRKKTEEPTVVFTTRTNSVVGFPPNLIYSILRRAFKKFAEKCHYILIL